ncbi:MAG TPA: twin-arginine translocation signal domain-containing protein [Sedimentisphaerales bacterium]|nr:twin-arginine translocation signal domain-containing protein [Sedimentisphaerales bacterium]
MINRRQFLKTTLSAATALVLPVSYTRADNCNPFKITVPMPNSVAIDDVGWKKGWSDENKGGPWRGGMPYGRFMGLEDYKVLAYIGKSLKTRLMCLFVMSEFDRSNICAQYPTSTQSGQNWDNSALVSDDDFTIMNYVKDNADTIEFGLHGVGHERWVNGQRIRAEFAGENGNKWPWKEVWGKMQCFKKLIDQYDISFPKSFVPCAFNYYYNPDDKQDTGALMSAWGVKYANNPNCTYLHNHGLMVLDRISESDMGYSVTSPQPKTLLENDQCYKSTHWSNYLDVNPDNNKKAADKWINYFQTIKKMPDRYLPQNTAQLYSQYLYKKFCKFTIVDNTVTINNTNMPDWTYEFGQLGNLLFKIPLAQNTHVSFAELNNSSIACYYEELGFAHVILPRLDKKIYKLKISISPQPMSDCLINTGTYNINKFSIENKKAIVSVEMYGTGYLTLRLNKFKPAKIKSSNKSLTVETSNYDQSQKMLNIKLKANNVQGSQADIVITG